MKGNSSSEFLLTELSTLRFAIPRPQDRASIPPIGVHGTHRSSWRRHKRKLPITASCGSERPRGKKKTPPIRLPRGLPGEFHDLRTSTEHVECLSPTSYAASQAFAARLLELGSAGIVYPCVRRAGGTCLVCFRPVLVTNVRRRQHLHVHISDSHTSPRIRRA